MTGVNNKGQVVGLMNGSSSTHLFLYSGGAIQDLGNLGGSFGALGTQAAQINNAGQIVTDRRDSTNSLLYFGGALQSLSTLLWVNAGWQLYTVNGINDAGQIGRATIGGQHGFLMTPQ